MSSAALPMPATAAEADNLHLICSFACSELEEGAVVCSFGRRLDQRATLMHATDPPGQAVLQGLEHPPDSISRCNLLPEVCSFKLSCC